MILVLTQYSRSYVYDTTDARVNIHNFTVTGTFTFACRPNMLTFSTRIYFTKIFDSNVLFYCILNTHIFTHITINLALVVRIMCKITSSAVRIAPEHNCLALHQTITAYSTKTSSSCQGRNAASEPVVDSRGVFAEWLRRPPTLAGCKWQTGLGLRRGR